MLQLPAFNHLSACCTLLQVDHPFHLHLPAHGEPLVHNLLIDISSSNCLHVDCILQLAQHVCLLTPDTQAVPAFPETIAVNLSIHSHPQIVGYTADPRGRMFSAIWMAAPAVGSIAWTVLTAARWAMTGGLVSQLGEEADARWRVFSSQGWAACNSLARAWLHV